MRKHVSLLLPCLLLLTCVTISADSAETGDGWAGASTIDLRPDVFYYIIER